MIQNAILACLPWAGLLLAAVVLGRIAIWFSGARLDLSKLKSTHRCEQGSVQSLSFVLTLPILIMIMMLIVQASQIMIANIVVHYAAYASARAAVVWLPSNVSFVEPANLVAEFNLIEEIRENGGISSQYRVQPIGDKYDKIRQAAVIAVAPLGPSRSLGYSLSSNESQTAIALANAYRGLDSDSQTNRLISQRLANKLAYCYSNTDVDVTFWHRFGPENRLLHDPPLFLGLEDFEGRAIGWQDHITSTVSFDVPLLPGPVRWFAPAARRGAVSKTDVRGEVYTFSISASATMGNEGQRPVLAYWQEEF